MYPDYKKMHELAEEGSEWLGRYLDDSRKQGVDYDAVLAASTLAEVKEMAANIKAQNKLYSDFVNECCYDMNFIEALDKAFRQTSCQELYAEYIEAQNNV